MFLLTYQTLCSLLDFLSKVATAPREGSGRWHHLCWKELRDSMEHQQICIVVNIV
jgi:hypothetical protein